MRVNVSFGWFSYLRLTMVVLKYSNEGEIPVSIVFDISQVPACG